MATIYRWIIKDGNFRTADRVKPLGKHEVRRNSRRAMIDAYAIFSAEMARTVPHGDGRSASALFEVVERGGYRTTLATYSGRETERKPTGRGVETAPVRGEWFLESDHPEFDQVTHHERIIAK